MLEWRAELQERWANRAALPLSEAKRRFLRAVAETLQRALNAEAVILFGSMARGERMPEVVL
jgi:predicted nucleotidyltransferase